VTAPVDSAHGVDPKQPQTLLDVPGADTLLALLTLWREQKKITEVVVVFDRSGSMNGRPLQEAKAGAMAFLDGLADRDAVSVLFFNDSVGDLEAPKPLATSRAMFKLAVDGIFAGGGTSLYDAIAEAHDGMLKRAQSQPSRIHAMVVMTDGRDEGSRLGLDQLLRRFTPEQAPVKIFTIAYGDQADSSILDTIASAAQGTSVKGTSETIVQVYRDLSAFF
jgi:Ca-activated chloride channel family protein